MTNEKKKELFPYFAWTYSKELDPAKYGEITDFEEWAKVIESNPKDIEKITEAASKLTEEDWEAIGTDMQELSKKEPAVEESIDEPKIARKGAKLKQLKKLQSYKKGKNIGVRKCSCGCAMVATKGKGGKMTSKCSCGCKLKK